MPFIKTLVARLFDWTLPVDRLGPLLDNLVETRDLTKFGTAVGTLKCSLKLEKAIELLRRTSSVQVYLEALCQFRAKQRP